MRASVYLTNITGRDEILDALVDVLPAAAAERRKPYSVWLHFDGLEPEEARGLVATELQRLHPEADPGDYLF